MPNKIEDAAGVGFLLALVGVAFCLWLDLEPLVGFCLGFVSGCGYRYFSLSLTQQFQNQESLLWGLLSLKVAQENGWDLNDYRNKVSHRALRGVTTRSRVAEKLYDLEPRHGKKIRRPVIRKWWRSLVSGSQE